jgi:dTDP-3-amino-3,4,6-trideoxy-alpha-D-glucose transaminase
LSDLVPFVDLARATAPIEAELQAAFTRVLRRGSYLLGPEVAAFESEFAREEGGGHGVCCRSGSDALYLALRALSIGPGDLVVTVANSFVATAESIARTGARVLFAEPDARTRNLDPVDLASVVATAPSVRAVIPVHLYGVPADIAGIRAALDALGRSDIVIIGDAAQAHGAEGVGTATPITCWSFYPAKNLGAFGDGGFVRCDDAAIAERIRSLRNHGRAGKHDVGDIGLNSRFDELQAAMLRVKLPHLGGWNRARRQAAATYRQALALLVAAERLRLPPDDPRSAHHLFVIEVRDRDAVASALRDLGVETGLHYPVPVHRMPPYPSARPLPRTERLCATVLSLPMFPGIRADEIERVADALTAALR